jgi:hypothetical protein
MDSIKNVCDLIVEKLNKEYKIFQWEWKEGSNDHFSFSLKAIDCPLLTAEALNEIASPADNIIDTALYSLSVREQLFSYKMMGVANGCDDGAICVLFMLNDIEPPNKPKRDKSAFMFFCSEHKESIKQNNPNISLIDLGRLLGQKWKECNDKEKYETLHRNDRKRYLEEMKSYVPNDD